MGDNLSMSIDGYRKFPNEASAKAWQASVFAQLGYTPKVQKETLTTQYSRLISHPSTGEVLVIVKEVAAHNPERQKSPIDFLTQPQKNALKDRDAWKADGFFPKDLREERSPK